MQVLTLDRFAVGARHTTRPHPSINGSSGELFVNRAKVYLNLELESPTLATIQALVLLCEYEAAEGRDSQGE